uniref:RRM domain-containing protein n=1 Tax=Acrobeloides nanus TaxID=290746 RepID=A0A914BV80_9BILA
MGDEIDEKTVFVRNLDEQVTEDLLKELFIQMGPIQFVHIRSNPNSRFAFVEFQHEESVIFACEMLNGIKLFDKNLTVLPRDRTKNAEAYQRLQRQQREEQSYRGNMGKQQMYHSQQHMDRNFVNMLPPVNFANQASPMTSYQNGYQTFRTPNQPVMRRSNSYNDFQDQRYSAPTASYGNSSNDRANFYREDSRNAMSSRSSYNDLRSDYNYQEQDRYRANNRRRDDEMQTPRGVYNKRQHEGDSYRRERESSGERRYDGRPRDRDYDRSPKRRRDNYYQ